MTSYSLGPGGQPIGASSFTKNRFKPTLVRAASAASPFIDLRHTFGSLLLDAGAQTDGVISGARPSNLLSQSVDKLPDTLLVVQRRIIEEFRFDVDFDPSNVLENLILEVDATWPSLARLDTEARSRQVGVDSCFAPQLGASPPVSDAIDDRLDCRAFPGFVAAIDPTGLGPTRVPRNRRQVVTGAKRRAIEPSRGR